MRKFLLIIQVFLFAFILTANAKVVENPPYAFKTSGVYNITKVESTNKETRVTSHVTFIPHWWVGFTKETFIEDSETGEKYYITDLKNGELDTKIFMPDSGDSTFVMVFPPLGKNTKKVNFGEGEKTFIYDIVISGNPENIKKDDAAALAWIDREVSEGKRGPLDPKSPDYLKNGTGRIVGYIKGYDPRAGFNTGIIYNANVITGEDYPLVVEIQPDGRFEAEVQLQHPKLIYIVVNNAFIPAAYVEQGSTVGVIIDWADFLEADRLRDRRPVFNRTEYRGPFVDIIKAVTDVKLKEVDYRQMKEMVEQSRIHELAGMLKETFNGNISSLNGMREKGEMSEDAYKTLEIIERCDYGIKMLESSTMRRYLAAPGTQTEPMAPDYYTFLKDMPLDDPRLLSLQNADIFLNRFEYLDIFMLDKYINAGIRPEKEFYEYLTEELSLVLSEEDNEYVEFSGQFNNMIQSGDKEELIKQYNSMARSFNEKYQEHYQGWEDKYIKPLMEKRRNRPFTVAAYRDSVVYNVLGLGPNLIYDITKVRQIEHALNGEDKEFSRKYMDMLTGGIGDPFVRSEAWRVFDGKLPEEGKQPYKLGDGKAADKFRELIAPFKGSLLLVDFWATWCGPCVGGIKSNEKARKEHESSGDVVYVFITDHSSPLDAYNSFVKEQGLINTFRVSDDDYIYFRQLFKFNGIPRYVLIGKNGDIIDDNYHPGNLYMDIEKYK